MDEKEILKRFWGVVSETRKEKEEFRESVEKAIDIYYNRGELREQSLEAGCYLAYFRMYMGETSLNNVFCSMGYKELLLPKLNKWMSDCIKEQGIDEEKKRQIEAELLELMSSN